jgi:hypothetical protein
VRFNAALLGLKSFQGGYSLCQSHHLGCDDEILARINAAREYEISMRDNRRSHRKVGWQKFTY